MLSHTEEWNKCNVFWHKRCTTTTASLRSICLNDLYRHENLWELTVEGDIHGAASPVANESLACLMSGQRGKRGVALLPALSGKAMADLRERIRLPGFYFAEEMAPKTPVWFFCFWAIAPAGWATRVWKEWVSVQCLFITGCHENKAVVIEFVIRDTPSSSQIKWAGQQRRTRERHKPMTGSPG